MDKIKTTYLLIYKYSKKFKIDTEYLEKNGISIKHADSIKSALKIAEKYDVGVFLVYYDSKDESSIYALRKMMHKYTYIQRLLLTPKINNEILELAVNKAHINYFLKYPIKKKKLLLFINKAFMRYNVNVRPFNRITRMTDFTNKLVEDVEKYHEQSTHDALTGLLNRRSFDRIIQRFDSLYKLKKIPFVVALIDLDKFKNINDTYGHAAGDEVLRNFGKIIKSCSRLGEDFIFRYGGEEFAAASHGNSEMEMLVYLNRLRKKIHNTVVKYKNDLIKFKFSAGIAMMKDGLSAEQLVRNADAALYYAKTHGRDKIICFDEKIMLPEKIKKSNKK